MLSLVTLYVSKVKDRALLTVVEAHDYFIWCTDAFIAWVKTVTPVADYVTLSVVGQHAHAGTIVVVHV